MRIARQSLRLVRNLLRPAYEREQLDILLEKAPVDGPLAERTQWLESLMVWVRTASASRHGFDLSTGQLHNVRLRFLFHLVERNPEWKARVAATLRSLVRETSALTLFAQVGLDHHRGFLTEAWERLVSRALPLPAAAHDLCELFLRIFEDERDAIWVSHVPSPLVESFLALVRYDAGPTEADTIFSHWRSDLLDALLILGSRIAAMGTLPEVRSRLPGHPVRTLPFVQAHDRLVQLVHLSHEGAATEEERMACLEISRRCREEVHAVYVSLEESGVNVSLVYTLESLLSTSRRIDWLLELMRPRSAETPALYVGFLSSLVGDRLSQRTLRSLVRTNLRLISRKIVERAGESGHHYVTHTRPEYFRMLRAGVGGGVVMVVTTMLKFGIMRLHLAPFFEGLFFSLNYASGFVLLQLLGFTLATKQPSATASLLAGKLRDLQEEGEVREFVNEVCRMTRTQFSALLGNLAGLVPFALLVDFVLRTLVHAPFLDTATAHHVLGSLDPVKSATVPMAALTGVYLWMSSLAAGWLENWVVFRRLPEALATHRHLIRALGPEGAKRVGRWTLANATLIGGNVSLGFLMGFTGALGRFLGLPLDVRHVTLSAASLTFAAHRLVPEGLPWSELLSPFIGIAVIGLFNFAVGYSLALVVASRARDVRRAAISRLLRALRVRLRNRPGEFFFPPAV